MGNCFYVMVEHWSMFNINAAGTIIKNSHQHKTPNIPWERFESTQNLSSSLIFGEGSSAVVIITTPQPMANISKNSSSIEDDRKTLYPPTF